MSDFGEFSKPSDEQSELNLSYEQLDKMSGDVKTLSMLREFAHERGYTFALTGGYAVDALVGGKISRFHGDMDGIMIAPRDASYPAIKEGIEEKLLVEETPWESVKEDDEASLEFREKAPDKEWEMRRRLELDIYPPGIKTATRTLKDVDGYSHEYEVLSVEGLLAAKVLSAVRLHQMTEEERVKENLREVKTSDREDFQRLLHASEFDEEATIHALADAIRYISDDEIPPQDAMESAKKQWTKALEIYN